MAGTSQQDYANVFHDFEDLFSGFGDFSSIFGSFFGEGAQQRGGSRVNRGANLRYDIELPFEKGRFRDHNRNFVQQGRHLQDMRRHRIARRPGPKNLFNVQRHRPNSAQLGLFRDFAAMPGLSWRRHSYRKPMP